MRVCFRTSVCGMIAAGASIASMTGATTARSVHIDNKNGHLVRSVVIAPRPALSVVEPTAAALPQPDPKLDAIVEAAAKQYDVDPLLIHSLIQVESGYHPNAVSPKGAQGLMQLIPSTARRFGAADSFDPKDNIFAGVKYLAYLNTLFPDDLQLTLAAYNAGEAAVVKHGYTVPPYAETVQYVKNVGTRYTKARKAAEIKKSKSAKASAPALVAEEQHPPVESFVDSEGRLHLRTKEPAEARANP